MARFNSKHKDTVSKANSRPQPIDRNHMMNFANLALAAAHFHGMSRDIEKTEHEIIRRACIAVWTEARRVLGTEGYSWPALSVATLAHKTHAGTVKETGELLDSIEWSSHGLEGSVGSNNDKAVIHELGTSKIPARTFLVGAALAMEGKIHKMAAKAVAAVISDGHLFGSEMRELIHALKHAAKDVKELAHEVLENDTPDGILK
jgi:phage gpG-like protein